MSTKRNRKPLPPGDHRHGTRNAYGNLGCRCDPCREANSAYCLQQKRSKSTKSASTFEPLDGERWRPIPDYEGLYEVSDLGRVRSLDRSYPHWSGKGTVQIKGRLMRSSSIEGGYEVVGLTKDGKSRHCGVHVLVLEAFVGPRPEGFDACHNNGRGYDNRVENLRWDTKSANTMDTVRHGTHPQTRKTHCPLGHDLMPVPGESRRRCVECRGRRAKKFGVGRGYWNASKTHCKRGHEFTPENTYIKPTGRECRTCARMHSRGYAQRKKLEMSITAESGTKS